MTYFFHPAAEAEHLETVAGGRVRGYGCAELAGTGRRMTVFGLFGPTHGLGAGG